MRVAPCPTLFDGALAEVELAIASGPIPTEASMRSGESAHKIEGWWFKSDDTIRLF
jgi:hypothetical protein